MCVLFCLTSRNKGLPAVSRKKKGIWPQFSKACKYVLGFEQGNKHKPFLLEACKYVLGFEMQLRDTEQMPQGERTWSAEYLFSIFVSSFLLQFITANYWSDWGRANSCLIKAEELKNPNACLNGKRDKEDCKNRGGKWNPKPCSWEMNKWLSSSRCQCYTTFLHWIETYVILF